MKSIILLIIFMNFPRYGFAYEQSGEWTSRGWHGESSGLLEIWGLIIVVLVVFGIIHLINAGFPGFFQAMGGLLILFIICQIIIGLLNIFGAGLNESDSLWLFIATFIGMVVYDFIKAKSKSA